MAGLVPAIHVFDTAASAQDVDGRDKRGHDDLDVMENTDRQPRAFFGRRKGHKLRPNHARLIETVLPRLAVDCSGPAPADLRTLFPTRVTDVRLEIGFGGGEQLIAQAVANPGVGFIGVEPFINGMAKALAAIESEGLANIRLHFDDAVHLIDWLPDHAVACVDLLFPDPWPKRRHWKRRFVQDDMVARLARILRPGGEFRFVTDIADYTAWTLQRLLRAPKFEWTAQCADDWRRPWPGFAGTRYQTKALQARRAPCFLVFRRR
jgi:tRNA (guanine-N7-)-methyltransferase